MNVNKFFSCYDDYSFIFLNKGGYPGYYNKNYFRENFETFQKKYNNNTIRNYLIYCIEKNEKLENIYLDIYSPFFDILMKTNFFSDKFIIVISMSFIKENKLEKDYISAFNKVNKLIKNYSLLFRFNNSKDIDYLKTFKINLSSIHILIILEEDKNYDYFFGKLFSFKENRTNLINLKISLKSQKIEAKLLQKINSFKFLEYLELNGIKFNSLFVLNLAKLKTLKIWNCDNLSFSNNISLNLTKLFFYDFMPTQQTILKFPKLEQCEFFNSFSDFNHFKYNSVFDISSMKNLTILKAEACDFLSLDNNVLLQNLDIFSNDNNIETENKVIEKIISMKSLKEVNLLLQKYDYNDISNIEGVNYSINMIKIVSKNCPEYNLLNLQQKLPNLSDIQLEVSYNKNKENNENNKSDIEIIEENNFKIKKLNINCSYSSIKLFCQSFQNLETIDIIIYGEMDNIKERFSFFADNCKLSYDSLNYFTFIYNQFITLDILYNLSNNFDNMKNVKILILDLKCKDLDEKYYNHLNKKLSLLNLDYIKCRIDNGKLYEEEVLIFWAI